MALQRIQKTGCRQLLFSKIAPLIASLPSRYLPLKPTSNDLETSLLKESDTPKPAETGIFS